MARWIVNKIGEWVRVKATCPKCGEVGRILNIRRIFHVNLGTGFHKVTRETNCENCYENWTEEEVKFEV